MQKNVDGNTFRNFLFNNILKWSDSGSYFTNKSPPKPKNPCTNLIHWTELMNALVKPHHRRQKAQSRKKAQCCRFGCFRLVFSSSRRLRSLWRQICKITNAKNEKTTGLGTGKTYFVPWEQGWGWVWLQWRMWRPPRELGKRHSSRTLSLKKTICWVWMWLGSKMLQIFVVEEFDPDFSFICCSSPVMSKLPFWSRSWICSNNPFQY